MNEENNRNEDQNKDELDKFESVSMRGPRKSIYQHTQGSLIIKATSTNDPLIKILAICEAAFNSKISNKLDIPLVDRIFSVAQSFRDTISYPDKTYLRQVNWCFEETPENYESLIKPWQKIGLRFYPLETHYRFKHYPPRPRYPTEMAHWTDVNEKRNEDLEAREDLKKYISAKIREMPVHEKFYEVTHALGQNGFRKLQSEFAKWALMELHETRNKLLDEISPDVWKDLTRTKTEDENTSEN